MQLGLNASSAGFSAFFAWDFGAHSQKADRQTPARIIVVKPVTRTEAPAPAHAAPAAVIEAAPRILRYSAPRALGQAPALQLEAAPRGQMIDLFA